MNGISYNFYYWGPYLWKSRLPLEFCDRFLELGLNLNNNHNDRLASLIDDTRYFDRDTHFTEFLDTVAPFFDCYMSTKKEYAKVDTDPVIKLESLWINFQKSKEFNPEHTHSCDLSFVIYLDVPDSIKKENEEYIGSSGGPGAILFRYGEQADWVVSHHKFIPEKGDIFVFPAMLAHSAFPFKSEGTRISMSGNLSFIYD